MKCIISSAENTQVLKHLHTITLPTHKGTIQVKQGHAEYFGEIVDGKIICNGVKITSISTPPGICHIREDVVTILI